MSRTHHAHHVERHFGGSLVVRDVVLGMSDGLTVPFALAAGLSGALGDSHLVITAGLAEIAAGAISMGLGGYLAGRGDVEHYSAELTRERREVVEVPHLEEAEIEAVFKGYGLTATQVAPIVAGLRANPEAWVDFMMRFELGLEKPNPRRATIGALTIGGSYALGGIVPLAPYLWLPNAHLALAVSAGFTLAALFVFGYVKGRFAESRPWRSAVQTVVIGGLAAACAYLLARAIS
jgi:VIT1/CCC1 family predicted Fe2+/Mn2+ transporter